MTTTTNEAKKTRTQLVRGWSWDLCKALPNVKVDEGRIISEQEIVDLLFNAARQWPNWTFTVNKQNAFIMQFGSEHLGALKYEYVTRSRNNLMCLYGDRVAQAQQRKDCYSSPDAAAVLRKMKEYIYPKTLEEAIEPKLQHMHTMVYTAECVATQERTEAHAAIVGAAAEFALSPQGREAFMAYEAVFGTSRDTVAALVTIDEADRRQKAASSMRTTLGNATAGMTRNKDGSWLVKFANEVRTYDDDEALPACLSNVHILKLVNNDTIVPGVGIRTTETIFAVVPV
jgi:hypothetical protein